MINTLVETHAARAMGTVYMKLVVWISMAVAPTAEVGFGKYPASTVMISYHHHSKQTPKQLGTARRSNGVTPVKAALDQPLHVKPQAPEKRR